MDRKQQPVRLGGQKTRSPWNQGEIEARDRGNPYPWNTPAHDVWNEGYQAAVSRAVKSILRSNGR